MSRHIYIYIYMCVYVHIHTCITLWSHQLGARNCYSDVSGFDGKGLWGFGVQPLGLKLGINVNQLLQVGFQLRLDVGTLL